jgi:hypothetical protein
MIDARGIPTCSCPNCGCVFFNAVVQFDPIDYEIGLYFLDGSCRDCGALITLPTPIDKIKGREQ